MPFYVAGATALGAVYSANSASSSASSAISAGQATNARSARFGKWQAKFQRRASNHAIRRRMNDMSRGGINPILAVNSIGASTPGAGSASFTNPSIAGAQAQAADAGATSAIVNSATGLVKAYAEINNIQATTVKILGETSEGQNLINQFGGAEKLAEMLAADPTVQKLVQKLLDSQPVKWLSSIAELLGLTDPSGPTVNISGGNPHSYYSERDRLGREPTLRQ